MTGTEYRTVTLRVSRQTRTAFLEGAQDLRLCDKVIFRVTNTPGVDAASLQLWVYSKLAAAGAYPALLSVVNGSFSAVSGSSDAAQTTAAVTVSSVPLLAALTPIVPGVAVTGRLYVFDANTTYVDQDLDIYPNPAFVAAPADPVGDPFITASDLAAAAASVASMPTSTPAEREARFAALIALLGAL